MALHILAAVMIMGLTAGICPINLTMVTSMAPHLIRSEGRLLSSVLFSAGISSLFVPLGIGASVAGEAVLGAERSAMYLVAGFLMIVIGLWALRVIKLPVIRTGTSRWTEGGPYLFGLAYAIATLGRGAPLLLSALSMAAVEGSPVVGGVSLLVYSFGMGIPMILLAALITLGAPERMEVVKRYSRKLDTLTGVILLAIGAYYLLSIFIFM